MKKIVVLLYLLLPTSLSVLYAQVPSAWKVVPSNFSNSMVITAVLNMESEQSRNPEDVVVAFIGDEVRGIASPSTYIKSKDSYMASLIVYSNDSNGLITFKLFNKVKNTITSAVTLPINFVADGQEGIFDNPVVIKDNTIPSALNLSSLVISENLAVGTLVGTLEVIDSDTMDTHILTFLDGSGYGDNAFFEIKNNALYTKSIFIFDEKSIYDIQIQAEDPKKGKIVKTFQIEVMEDKISEVLEFNNLITPNGDGFNDVLKINYIRLYVDYNLSIFNSRGQQVFSTDNYLNNWNGADNPNGVYYLYFTGKNQAGKQFTYKEALRIINY